MIKPYNFTIITSIPNKFTHDPRNCGVTQLKFGLAATAHAVAWPLAWLARFIVVVNSWTYICILELWSWLHSRWVAQCPRPRCFITDRHLDKKSTILSNTSNAIIIITIFGNSCLYLLSLEILNYFHQITDVSVRSFTLFNRPSHRL